jgi:DNA-binding beta-propeller fold protein YncE
MEVTVYLGRRNTMRPEIPAAGWPRGLKCAALVMLMAGWAALPGQAVAFVYVANEGVSAPTGPGSVSQYGIGAGGLLAPLSPSTVAAGSNSEALAVSPKGDSLYVANASSDNVSQYDVGAGGALSPKSPATVAAGDGPFGVAVSPDGQSV